MRQHNLVTQPLLFQDRKPVEKMHTSTINMNNNQKILTSKSRRFFIGVSLGEINALHISPPIWGNLPSPLMGRMERVKMANPPGRISGWTEMWNLGTGQRWTHSMGPFLFDGHILVSAQFGRLSRVDFWHPGAE